MPAALVLSILRMIRTKGLSPCLGSTTTIMNLAFHQQTMRNNQGDENTRTAKDLTDDEIEKAIAEIQAAINEAQIYTVFT